MELFTLIKIPADQKASFPQVQRTLQEQITKLDGRVLEFYPLTGEFDACYVYELPHQDAIAELWAVTPWLTRTSIVLDEKAVERGAVVSGRMVTERERVT